MLLLKLQSAADTSSPEAAYQLSHLAGEARRVLATVEVVPWREGSPKPQLPEDRDVLVVDEGSVLLTARSLAAMAERRREGADLVMAHRLEELPGLAPQPIYSLRGFERVEASFLASGRPAQPPPRLLPVALLSDALASTLPNQTSGLRDWRPPAGVRAASAGLCHRFVDYYGELRDDVRPFVPAGVREVLEVGCGRGATARWLQETFGCRVTGVELNPAAAAEAARDLAAVHCGDVATAPLGGPYDLVVALELFEHLPRAESVLARLAEHTRPGGRILLSVPNVGHHSVVLDLLAGRWDYLPIGLLCYTHYRFFTRATLESWLWRCGFRRFELVAQRTEMPAEVVELPPAYGADLASLATKGFWVVIERE
jgi:SAM-dependent methyltransferase